MLDPRLSTVHRIAAPISSHRRRATCDEVGCKYQREGWKIVAEIGPQADQVIVQAKLSGRDFELTHELSYSLGVRRELEKVRTEKSREEIEEWLSIQDKTMHAILSFSPGQQCFKSHTASLHKPPLYLVRDGARPYRQIESPAEWVNHFQTHLQKTADQ